MVDFSIGDTIETFFNTARIGSLICWGANKEFIEEFVVLKNTIIIYCSNERQCQLLFDEKKIITEFRSN